MSEPAGGRPTSCEPGPEQIDLFAERARLARDLDAALHEGAFPEARRLRGVFEETYGTTEETRALGCLDPIAEALASPLPEEAVPAWARLDPGLDPHPRLRRLVRDGVLRRLLRSCSPDDVLAAAPEALPTLAWVLASGANPDDGKREARRLVRDALLGGRFLESPDFAWDGTLADLLAEDEKPGWLACLGAIRRLWPTPRPGSEALATLSHPFLEPASPAEAALLFWSCLRAAEARDCPEPLLLEARRRMKRLRPAFHTLYMRRAAPRS